MLGLSVEVDALDAETVEVFLIEEEQVVGAVDKDVGACIEVIGDEGVALGERGIVFGGEGERLVVEVDAIVDVGFVEQNAVDVGDGENEFGASEFIIGVIRL